MDSQFRLVDHPESKACAVTETPTDWCLLHGKVRCAICLSRSRTGLPAVPVQDALTTLRAELATANIHLRFFQEEHKKSTDTIAECSRIFESAVSETPSLARMFLPEQCAHLVAKLAALRRAAGEKL